MSCCTNLFISLPLLLRTKVRYYYNSIEFSIDEMQSRDSQEYVFVDKQDLEDYEELSLKHQDRAAPSSTSPPSPHELLQGIILQWVTYSIRPLRLLELADVLATTVYQPYDVGEMKSRVREACICISMIKIMDDDTLILMEELSTTIGTSQIRCVDVNLSSQRSQFPILDAQASHQLLASLSLQYLHSGCLSSEDVPRSKAAEALRAGKEEKHCGLRLKHPFLEYASPIGSSMRRKLINWERMSLCKSTIC